MKKQKTKTILIIVTLAVIVGGIILVTQAPKWSDLAYEAVVKEIVTQPDGEVRLIVERTSEIYGSPTNSLGISESTKLLDVQGKEIPISDFKQGTAVKVSLKDAFTEEVPVYYPTVYEVRMIDTEQ